MIQDIYRIPTNKPDTFFYVGLNPPSGQVVFKVEINGVRVDDSVVVLDLPAFSLLASLLTNCCTNTRREADDWPQIPFYTNEQIQEFKMQGEKVK